MQARWGLCVHSMCIYGLRIIRLTSAPSGKHKNCQLMALMDSEPGWEWWMSKTHSKKDQVGQVQQASVKIPCLAEQNSSALELSYLKNCTFFASFGLPTWKAILPSLIHALAVSWVGWRPSTSEEWEAMPCCTSKSEGQVISGETVQCELRGTGKRGGMEAAPNSGMTRKGAGSLSRVSLSSPPDRLSVQESQGSWASLKSREGGKGAVTSGTALWQPCLGSTGSSANPT